MLPRSMSIGSRSSLFSSRLMRTEFCSVSRAFEPFAKKAKFSGVWSTQIYFRAQGSTGHQSGYPNIKGSFMTWHLIRTTKGKKFPLAYSVMLPGIKVLYLNGYKRYSERTGRALYLTTFENVCNDAASSDIVKMQDLLPSGSKLAARFTPVPVRPITLEPLYENWFHTGFRDWAGYLNSTSWEQYGSIVDDSNLVDFLGQGYRQMDDVLRAPFQPRVWSERTWGIFRQLETAESNRS
jgi:hypothetical protein